MAGSFDLWITADAPFVVLAPKSGDTGTFDTWIYADLPWPEYAEAAAVGGVTVPALDEGMLTGGLQALSGGLY